MKSRIVVKEINYGYVDIEVPDGTSLEAVHNIAEDEYAKGNVNWTASTLDVC